MGSKSNPADALAAAIDAKNDLDDFALAESGAPIPFQVGERFFAMRQPEAHEYELIRLWEQIGFSEAMLEAGMDKMTKLPVSDEAKRAREERLASLQEQIASTSDTKQRREIDEQIKRLERPDMRNRAEELAEGYSYRYRDIQMIRRLLVQPDGTPIDKDEIERLLRVQVFVDVARIACFRIIKLMLSLPNWIERPA